MRTSTPPGPGPLDLRPRSGCRGDRRDRPARRRSRPDCDQARPRRQQADDTGAGRHRTTPPPRPCRAEQPRATRCPASVRAPINPGDRWARHGGSGLHQCLGLRGEPPVSLGHAHGCGRPGWTRSPGGGSWVLPCVQVHARRWPARGGQQRAWTAVDNRRAGAATLMPPRTHRTATTGVTFLVARSTEQCGCLVALNGSCSGGRPVSGPSPRRSGCRGSGVQETVRQRGEGCYR